MERRPHPNYSRKVAGFSFGLFGVSLACLVVGFALQRFGLPLLSDILFFAFAVGSIATLATWFAAGESTSCPQCGRHLRAETEPGHDENVVFHCPDCDIEWQAGDLREP